MRDAGSLLVRAGLIDDEALAAARANRARQGGTLAEHLVLAGAVADEELTQFYRERLMVPRVGEDRLRNLSKKIVGRIPRELASELRVVPVALDSESSLTVAMSDPSDTHALDELEFFTEHYVVRAVASQAQIAWCLDNYYQVRTPFFEATAAETRDQVIGFDSDEFDSAETERRTASSLEPSGKRSANASRPSRPRPSTSRGVEVETDEATLADLESDSASLFERANDSDTLRAENLEIDHELLIAEDSDEILEIGAELAAEIDPSAPQTLEDGSPIELAPRVGEVIVNQDNHHQVGGGPAIIVDDSVFSENPTEIESKSDEDLVVAGGRDVVGDYDDLVISRPTDERAQTHDDETAEDVKTIDESVGASAEASDVEDNSAPTLEPVIEADEPGESEASSSPSNGVVIEVVERGTDSAPFLLSDIKAAAAKREKEAEAHGAGDEDDDASEEGDEPVVLLSVTKRPRRATKAGVGVPRERAARALGLKTSSAPLSGSLEAVARAHIRRTQELTEGDDAAAGPPTIIDDTNVSSELAAIDAGENAAAAESRSKRSTPSPVEPTEPVLSSADAAAARELESSFDQRSAEPGLEGPESDRMLDVLEALAGAGHRDQIVTAVLDYLDQYCDRVVFLALRSGALEPWQVRTARTPINVPPGTRLPLRENSLLRDIVDTRLPYRGPMLDARSARLLTAVFGKLGSDGLAVPVAVRGRVVGLLYGDGISTSLSGDSVGLVTRAAGRALERTLVSGS